LGWSVLFARGDGDDYAIANAARTKEIDEAGSHDVAVQIGPMRCLVERDADTTDATHALNERRAIYYGAGWQILEEHVDASMNDSYDSLTQNVWGLRYPSIKGMSWSSVAPTRTGTAAPTPTSPTRPTPSGSSTSTTTSSAWSPGSTGSAR
jgi:hypothetical protein